MSVLKAYWELGIGAVMIDALVSWARENGVVKNINLRVPADNLRAIRLYERKGFVREGTVSEEYLIDDTFFDSHLMGLT